MNHEEFPYKELLILGIIFATLYGLSNPTDRYVTGICNSKFYQHPEKVDACVKEYTATHSSLFG